MTDLNTASAIELAREHISARVEREPVEGKGEKFVVVSPALRGREEMRLASTRKRDIAQMIAIAIRELGLREQAGDSKVEQPAGVVFDHDEACAVHAVLHQALDRLRDEFQAIELEHIRTAVAKLDASF